MKNEEREKKNDSIRKEKFTVEWNEVVCSESELCIEREKKKNEFDGRQ